MRDENKLTRHNASLLSLALALSTGACVLEDNEPTVGNDEHALMFPIYLDVLPGGIPNGESTYAAFGHKPGFVLIGFGNASPFTTYPSYTMDVSGTGDDRNLHVRISDGRTGTTKLDSTGAVRQDQIAFPFATDILDYHPPRYWNGRTSFWSAPPTRAAVTQADAANQMFLTNRLHSAVIATSNVNGARVVRVATKQLLVASALANGSFGSYDEPSTTDSALVSKSFPSPAVLRAPNSGLPFVEAGIFSTALGTSTVGVADLVHLPGHGWILLRAAKFFHVDTNDQSIIDNPTYDKVKDLPRKEMTIFCLSRTDAFGQSELTGYTNALPQIDAFDACNQ